MMLMVEDWTRGLNGLAILQNLKAINKYMKQSRNNKRSINAQIICIEM